MSVTFLHTNILCLKKLSDFQNLAIGNILRKFIIIPLGKHVSTKLSQIKLPEINFAVSFWRNQLPLCVAVYRLHTTFYVGFD